MESPATIGADVAYLKGTKVGAQPMEDVNDQKRGKSPIFQSEMSR